MRSFLCTKAAKRIDLFFFYSFICNLKAMAWKLNGTMMKMKMNGHWTSFIFTLAIVWWDSWESSFSFISFKIFIYRSHPLKCIDIYICTRSRARMCRAVETREKKKKYTCIQSLYMYLSTCNEKEIRRRRWRKKKQHSDIKWEFFVHTSTIHHLIDLVKYMYRIK